MKIIKYSWKLKLIILFFILSLILIFLSSFNVNNASTRIAVIQTIGLSNSTSILFILWVRELYKSSYLSSPNIQCSNLLWKMNIICNSILFFAISPLIIELTYEKSRLLIYVFISTILLVVINHTGSLFYLKSKNDIYTGLFMTLQYVLFFQLNNLFLIDNVTISDLIEQITIIGIVESDKLTWISIVSIFTHSLLFLFVITYSYSCIRRIDLVNEKK